ncbi:DNA glycosylase [Tricholoma matsutake]|nr:DNA glycosylase [Tricholoma matsutake 945]
MGKRRLSDKARTRSCYDHASEDEACSDNSRASNYEDTLARRKTHRKRHKSSHEAIEFGKRPVNPNSNAISHSRSSHNIQSPDSIRVALLRWYAGVYASRGMPWRKLCDPSEGVSGRAQRAYKVWVSEIMLQQTQVSTVIPYYTRWMEKFPTIRDLAAANIDEVNALWKGLGYYSRASRLLAGAQKVVEKYDGKLPDNAKDMEASIPGIGRYSAGAICSIAYGERVPVLDGNVHRLLSRFLALHAPPKAKATLDVLWAAATAIVQIEENSMLPHSGNTAVQRPSMEDAQHPGDINQALIELGSTVCKIREPDCGSCPLRAWCRAYAVSNSDVQKQADIEDACTLCTPLQGDSEVTSYPIKVERKKSRDELDVVNVIEWHCNTKPDERWFLLVRRPEGGLLAGLYEFPTSANVSKTTSHDAMARIPNKLLSRLLSSTVPPYNKNRSKSQNDALQIKELHFAGDVVHVFSHIKKTYRTQWVVLQGGENLPSFRQDITKQPGKHVEMSDKEKLMDGGDDELSTPLSAGPVWIKLEDVSNANMGTGVVKVWNLTKNLWERDISGS